MCGNLNLPQCESESLRRVPPIPGTAEERLMGFEPTTFCMASASLRALQMGRNRSRKRKDASHPRTRIAVDFTRIHVDLGTRERSSA